VSAALADLIAAESRRDTFAAAKVFGAHLGAVFGPATAGVIFYGSCLRQQTDEGLMLDFYVLVDSYRAALRNRLSATFAWLLPPNVYYFEIPFEGRRLRAKVAVMSVSQFLRAVEPTTFAASVWARFAQPALILSTRNDEIRRRLERALATAVQTTVTHIKPLLAAPYTARELWVRAFRETYAAELRPEKDNKAGELVDAEMARYAAATTAVLGPPDADGAYHDVTPETERKAAAQAWKWRRVAGKTLNALRLIKAAFTFKGGLDYAVWKIERHAGVKIELSAAARKRPLITGVRLFLGTLKRGGLR
jgi:hypothetical protein